MIALDFKRRVLDCAAGAQPRLQFLEQCLPIFFWNLETLDYRDGLPTPQLPVQPNNNLLMNRIQLRLDTIFDRFFLSGDKLVGAIRNKND